MKDKDFIVWDVEQKFLMWNGEPREHGEGLFYRVKLVFYRPYAKMAAILIFYCLHSN